MIEAARDFRPYFPSEEKVEIVGLCRAGQPLSWSFLQFVEEIGRIRPATIDHYGDM